MRPLTPTFLDEVEKAIKDMGERGVVPSIQRLEVMMKHRRGASDADLIREATKELLEKKRIPSLPLDQPETSTREENSPPDVQ